MKVTIEIAEIVILTGSGTDRVLLHTTDLPPAVYPYEGALTLEFSAAARTGRQYAEQNFKNIPVKEIQV